MIFPWFWKYSSLFKNDYSSELFLFCMLFFIEYKISSNNSECLFSIVETKVINVDTEAAMRNKIANVVME